MQLADALAIVFAVAAGVAFVLGERSLAAAQDVRALYWLAVGAASLYGAVSVARPGAKA